MHKESLRPLIYLQDIGGTRFLIPIINPLVELFKKFKTIFLYHDLASELSSSLSTDINESSKHTNINNFSIKQWKTLLSKENIGIVICTMSSKYIDMTNCNLIAACNELGIKSIGFFDHWKGFDRLKDQSEKFKYLTSTIGVIDNYVKDKLIIDGVDSKIIEVIGHPLLETILPQSFNNNPSEVIIISQPNIIDKTFEGIFNLPLFENNSFIERFDSIISSAFDGLKIYYRPHPKEKNIQIRDLSLLNESWDELNKKKKIFIGFDSMMLLESHLSNHEVIILKFPEFKKYSDQSIPYDFGHSVKDFNELKKRLFTIVSDEYNNQTNAYSYREVISHSIDRSKNLIENAILKY